MRARILFTFLCLAALVPAMVAVMAPEASGQGLMMGDAAPDFKLPGVDGEDHALEDYKDAKVLVVLFTCNHCPTSQMYEPRIKKFVEDYKEKGVQVVAISPNDPAALRLDEMGMTDLDDSFESMKLRAEDKEFNFPYLYSGDKPEIAKAYGATVTPEVFIFDGERKLRYRGRWDDSQEEAYVSRSDVNDAVDAILAGKEVEIAWTRPFGCSVKWPAKKETVERAMQQYAEEPVFLEAAPMKLLPAVLANRSGIVRVVHFWSAEDKKCDESIDVLVEIDRMYRRHPMVVITLNVDAPETREALLEKLEERGASCLNLMLVPDSLIDVEEGEEPDETLKVDMKAVAKAVGDTKWEGETPYALIVAPGGKAVWEQQGQVEPLALRRAILEALQVRPVEKEDSEEEPKEE